jgi:uncharacterized protein YjbI with pentapeptide repeats
MSKKAWKPYITRLRKNPEDQDALDQLEALLAQPRLDPQRTAKRAGLMGRFGLKMFLGKPLHKAVQDGWDAWADYFHGTYEPRGATPWPELETRDITAALASRFLRIGAFGILVGLIPAIILAFQTALMLIQVWQVNVQNDIVREQNVLTRQQFAVGYSTQLKQQVYAGDCTDRTDPATCTPSELPGVRADAVQALVRLADIASQGEVSEDTSRARIKGALLQQADLSGMDFARVDLDHTVFDYATLTQTSLDHASLKDASFAHARIDDSTFNNARLPDAKFERVRINDSSFEGANLQGVSFEKAIIKQTSMRNARFYLDDKPVLRDRGQIADFSTAETLSDVNFDGANLIKANFSGKNWLRLSFKTSDLTQSSFANATLTKSNLSGANLSGANLSGANLIDVDLTDATFKGAKTSGIKLNNVTCPNGKKAQSSCTF